MLLVSWQARCRDARRSNSSAVPWLAAFWPRWVSGRPLHKITHGPVVRMEPCTAEPASCAAPLPIRSVVQQAKPHSAPPRARVAAAAQPVPAARFAARHVLPPSAHPKGTPAADGRPVHPDAFAVTPARHPSVSLMARLAAARPPALPVRPAVTESAARKIRFVSKAAARPLNRAPRHSFLAPEGLP